MYVMLRVDIDSLAGIKDDAEFAKQLLVEQNLVVLPGQCFGMRGFVRLITCPTEVTMREAFARIKIFISTRGAGSPTSKRQKVE
jgi:tyrosine aminotransferase